MKITSAAVREEAANCGFFLAVFLAAFALKRALPHSTALTCALGVLPYLIILGFNLFCLQRGHPCAPQEIRTTGMDPRESD
jgi:hypothetical protein